MMAEHGTALEVVWRNAWVRAVAYTALIMAGLVLLWQLRHAYGFALTVALIGYIIAYILNPLVELLQRLRVGRPLAVVLVYLLLLQLFVVGSFLTGQVIAQMGEFARLLPAAINTLTPQLIGAIDWLQALPTSLFELLGVDVEPAENGVEAVLPIITVGQQMLADFFAQAATMLRELLQRLLAEGGDLLFAGVAGVVAGGVAVVFILLVSAYFLYDFPKFGPAFMRYVPVRWRPVTRDVLSKTGRVVGGFLRGQLLIVLLMGITFYIGLSLAQVPLALSISFFAALFNIVPYLGPIVGTVPAVLLGLTVSPWSALGALAVFVIANQLDTHLYSPLVFGKTTNIHPVTVIIAILVGVGLLGILGVLLAIPLVALAKVLLEEYLLKRPAYLEPAPPIEAPEVTPGRSDSGSERRQL
ncbi:MAG: AI-2E family transporter [Truepera sp.]|nr:AI-2E family transporter [Truepera sp.]